MYLVYKLLLLLFVTTTTGHNSSLLEPITTTLSTIIESPNRVFMSFVCLIHLIWLVYYYKTSVVAPTRSIDILPQSVASDTDSSSTYPALAPQVIASGTVRQDATSDTDSAVSSIDLTDFEETLQAATSDTNSGFTFTDLKDLLSPFLDLIDYIVPLMIPITYIIFGAVKWTCYHIGILILFTWVSLDIYDYLVDVVGFSAVRYHYSRS